jgi:hypothetical protein
MLLDGVQLGGGEFAVGDSTIYKIDENNNVDAWTGSGQTWTKIGGPAVAIYAGAEGLFDSQLDANTYRYNGTPGSWSEIGGPGADFESSSTRLYGLGPGNAYVAVWSGSGTAWTQIGGPGWQIAAGD